MKTKVDAGQQLFNIRVASGVFFCSDATVRRLVRTGELEHVRVGHSIRFTKQMLDSYLAKSKPRG